MLYGSEAWFLEKKQQLKFYQWVERSMVSTMCGVQLKDGKRPMELMLMLGLSETLDHLAMAGSVCWYGHVLRREDGHVFRRALGIYAEGRRNKGWPNMTWKKQVEEESMKVGLSREDVLCRSNWIVSVNLFASSLR